MNFLEKETKVVDALKSVFDPEIPVNIYDLGLVYEIRVNEDDSTYIKMTLTNPNCPVADEIPRDVKDAVLRVEGIKEVNVDLVFEPEWNKDMMSEAAMLELGLL
ncbi:MAG: iron-sulfur cluster assembly protein [Bacteroides sp.]|jgi:FeS assembly SUF system protein|nr:iron-sulfur cluster assembly protein [Bacteroides sp.]